VSSNKNDSGNVTGYTLPLTLWNKEGPTDDQVAFISTLENIIKSCKEHIVNNRKSIARPTITFESLCDIDKLLYYKIGEDGERVVGRGPAMYPKLFTRMMDGEMTITTEFIDTNGNDIDPMSLIGKYGHASPALFVDHIYIGAKISLQVYVGEAIVKLVNSGHRGILPRPKADGSLHFGEPFQLPVVNQPVDFKEDIKQDDQIVDDDPVIPVVNNTPPRAPPKRLPVKAKK
jgi:hypothetical protein